MSTSRGEQLGVTMKWKASQLGRGYSLVPSEVGPHSASRMPIRGSQRDGSTNGIRTTFYTLKSPGGVGVNPHSGLHDRRKSPRDSGP